MKENEQIPNNTEIQITRRRTTCHSEYPELVEGDVGIRSDEQKLEGAAPSKGVIILLSSPLEGED